MYVAAPAERFLCVSPEETGSQLPSLDPGASRSEGHGNSNTFSSGKTVSGFQKCKVVLDPNEHM